MGLLLNLVSLASALQLTGMIKDQSRAVRLAAFGLIWTGLVAGSMLLAGGLLGRLDAVTLAAIHIAVLLATAAFARVGPLRVARGVTGAARDAVELLRRHRTLAAACSLLILVYGYVLLIGVVFPPIAGDALMYHLPVGVTYIEQGDLSVPALPGFWKGNLWAYYPANGSLLLGWSMLTTGSDRLVDLVQWPFALLSGVALLALGRGLGLSRADAIWAGLLFSSVPIVINQAKTSLNDVLFAYLVICAVTFLARFRVHHAWHDGALTGLAVGLAFGVKPSAPLHIVLLALLGCVYVAFPAGRPGRLAVRPALICAGMTMAGGALFGAGWYLRNFLAIGEATYPSSVVDVLQLNGPDVIWENLRALFEDKLSTTHALPGIYYNYANGVGLQTTALIFPGAVLGVVRFFGARRYRPALLGLVAVAGCCLWWFILHPRFTNTSASRYALPWIGVLAPVAVVALRDLLSSARLRTVLLAAAVFHSSVLAMPMVGSFWSYEGVAQGLGAMLGPGVRFDPWRHRGDVAIYDYRDAWKWIEENTDGDRLLVVNHAFTYPLYGPGPRRNEIVVLPPLERDAWKAEVMSRDIDYVVARSQFTRRYEMQNAEYGPGMKTDGPSLAAIHRGNVYSLESFMLSHPIADRHGDVPVRSVEITYVTVSSYAGRMDPGTRGRFVLALNGGERIFDLPWSALREDGPEDPVPRTETFELPAGTTMREIGVGYFDQPLKTMRMSCGIQVDELAIESGQEARWGISLDPRHWRLGDITLQESWMKDDPDSFELVHSSTDEQNAWRSDHEFLDLERLNVYRVLRGESEGE